MSSSIKPESEENLQITIPRSTKRSLRMAAAESGETMRVVVLRALHAAGIQVPKKELYDRRKKKSGDHL